MSNKIKELNKIYKAFSLIRETCKKSKCVECIFFDENKYRCNLHFYEPFEWKIGSLPSRKHHKNHWQT